MKRLYYYRTGSLTNPVYSLRRGKEIIHEEPSICAMQSYIRDNGLQARFCVGDPDEVSPPMLGYLALIILCAVMAIAFLFFLDSPIMAMPFALGIIFTSMIVANTAKSKS